MASKTHKTSHKAKPRTNVEEQTNPVRFRDEPQDTTDAALERLESEGIILDNPAPLDSLD